MIVIDTNVFVGACMGVGASAKVIELCITGLLKPAMGSVLVMEYEDVMGRSPLFENLRIFQPESA